MNWTVDRRDNVIWVVCGVAAQWNLNQFFPILDSMFQSIKETWEATPAPVVFDLGSIAHIDSTFISLIVQVTRLTGSHKNAVLTSAPQCRELLDLLGVNEFVEIFDSADQWRKSGAGGQASGSL